MGVLQEKLHEAKTRTEHRIGIKDELELLEVCASYTRYKIWKMGKWGGGCYCHRRGLAMLLGMEKYGDNLAIFLHFRVLGSFLCI